MPVWDILETQEDEHCDGKNDEQTGQPNIGKQTDDLLFLSSQITTPCAMSPRRSHSITHKKRAAQKVQLQCNYTICEFFVSMCSNQQIKLFCAQSTEGGSSPVAKFGELIFNAQAQKTRQPVWYNYIKMCDSAYHFCEEKKDKEVFSCSRSIKNCVCCHNCRMECPMQAINFVGMKYQIDPDKCVSAAVCQGLPHGQSIHNGMSPKTVVPPCSRVELHRRCGGGGRRLAAWWRRSRRPRPARRSSWWRSPRCWAATPTMPTPFPGVYQVAREGRHARLPGAGHRPLYEGHRRHPGEDVIAHRRLRLL